VPGQAIDDCHARHPTGAVVLLSGPATYKVTGSLALTDDMTLQLDHNVQPVKERHTEGRHGWLTCLGSLAHLHAPRTMDV